MNNNSRVWVFKLHNYELASFNELNEMARLSKYTSLSKVIFKYLKENPNDIFVEIYLFFDDEVSLLDIFNINQSITSTPLLSIDKFLLNSSRLVFYFKGENKNVKSS